MPIQIQSGGDDSSSAPLPLSPSLLADESALKNAFLAEYPAIAAEARRSLGGDAAALTPKVIEGAFVRAWDARTCLSSREQLRQFLMQDVQHASARALSRRAAAHRFTQHEITAAAHVLQEVSIEQSWAHIQHALHGEAHSPKALAEAAEHSRHEAALHIKNVTRDKSTWAAVAVGTLAVAALIGGSFALDRLGTDDRIATAVNATDARVVNSLPGQIGIVTLDDGSIVRLAPESKLFIPKNFDLKLRAVRLEGTGNFQVAPGKPTLMQVHAGNVVLVAKGTQFVVHADPADSAVTVVVSEGTVEVRQNAKPVQTLTVGQASFAHAGSTPRVATAGEKAEADGWRAGELDVSNRSLHDVLPLLRRWYGLNIALYPESLGTRSVTMRASLDSSRQALREIEHSTGLEFGYIGQNMVFRKAETAKR